ncbi:hypothetical protein HJFPF1_07081 [Paramyrothecium foliicola]|nr:hypothetical protein HJFPF1_07081 [Paramyrothecium foliicola]
MVSLQQIIMGAAIVLSAVTAQPIQSGGTTSIEDRADVGGILDSVSEVVDKARNGDVDGILQGVSGIVDAATGGKGN